MMLIRLLWFSGRGSDGCQYQLHNYIPTKNNCNLFEFFNHAEHLPRRPLKNCDWNGWP